MAGYEKGFDRVIANIRAMAAHERGKLMESAIVVGGTLLEATRENVGLTDHSQEDLDSMGNPYSKRMGVNSGPHPDPQLHIQTGLLYQNVQQDITVLPDRIRVTVGVDETAVPYIDDLINGTSKMRPRDFLTDTLNHERHKISVIVASRIGKGG